MRLPQTVFLACAAGAVFATLWYMAFFSSIEDNEWEVPGNTQKPSSISIPSPSPTLNDYEVQIARLQKALREKDHQLEDKDTVIKSKEYELQKSDEKIKLEAEKVKLIQEQQKKHLEEEKKKAEEEKKKKEKEEQKKKDEEEKIKKQKEKEDEERKRLTDAYYTIRDRMLLEEHKLLEPIDIPEEEKNGLYDKKGKLLPNGKQILLLSAFDGQGSTQNNLTESLMSNRQEYCDYHGYIHLFVNTTKYKKDDPLKRSPVWFKLPAIKEAFEKYPDVEWIWWVDTDIIIMNEQIDLASHLLNPYILAQRLTYGRPINDLGDHLSGSLYPPKEHVDISNIDFIFTQDNLGVNAGSFFVKRSEFTNFILDMWGDPFLIQKKFSRAEQDAFIYLFTNHKTIFQRTGLVPQRMMNAYHNYYLHTANWQKGDLAIHFAGHNKGRGFERRFLDYWKKRERVPEEFRIEIPEPELFREIEAEILEEQKQKEAEDKKKKEEEAQKKKEEEDKKKEQEANANQQQDENKNN